MLSVSKNLTVLTRSINDVVHELDNGEVHYYTYQPSKKVGKCIMHLYDIGECYLFSHELLYADFRMLQKIYPLLYKLQTSTF